MSNKSGVIFAIIWSFCFSCLLAIPATQRDSLLKIADSQFEYEQFHNAITIYESLYEKGYFQEQMLYRLAFMYEQLRQYPQSIFYLRKLQWEIGGDHIEEKINGLMEKINQERRATGESWPAYRLAIKRYHTAMIIGTGICIFLVVLLLFLKRFSWTQPLAVALAAFAISLSVLLIEQQLRVQPKAVIIQSTLFYELPAFAAAPRVLPIGPGVTVTIQEEQDIWYRISIGQFESWVPKTVLRKL